MFNEIYGNYYKSVSVIIAEALSGGIDRNRLKEIVEREAFGESIVTIPDALLSGRWPLLKGGSGTVIKSIPSSPMTRLQKSWLSAIASDPRVRLFYPDAKPLDEVEPLYDKDTFVFYDRYLDGDDYEDAGYSANFRTVLKAIKEKKWLLIRFYGSRGRRNSGMFIPCQLEYSSKDDKFRLIATNDEGTTVINISRIVSCNVMHPYTEDEYREPEIRMSEVEFELTDERNALERIMLHFSHLEKETQKIGDNKYLVRLKYQKDDETEILIRMLSFGPMVKVLSPQRFVRKMKERIEKQTDHA